MFKRALDLAFSEHSLCKARVIYTQRSLEQRSDYEKVKELILKAYELVPEAYRQNFRDCRKEHDQTHVEFAVPKNKQTII